MFKLVPFGAASYKVTTRHTDVVLGEFYQEVDGYYVWQPENYQGGCYSQEFLESLVKELQRLNAPWDAQVKAYFDQEDPLL